MTDKFDLCNNACRAAFDKIVEIAISRHVDFVLIAGDSFDNCEHDLSEKLLFIRNLEKLADNGIKSYIICGNHDPVEFYKKYESYFKFNEKYKGLINISGITTPDKMTIFNYNDIVNIHALSFETDECSNPVKYLKTPDSENIFNIGLIHCDLDKTESKYAPCSRSELKALGYDYYALGHIHIPSGDDLVYSGSPQGRTKKETGEHGCYYIEADGKNILKKEFIPTDFVRFSSLDLDCSVFLNKKEVFDRIIEFLGSQTQEVPLMLYEINLAGITNAYEDLDSNLISEYVENYFEFEPAHTAVYKINNHTTPEVDEKELTDDKGIIGILINDTDINEIYDNIANLHHTLYQTLGLNTELKNDLVKHLTDYKEDILNQAKNEIKTICKEIFHEDSEHA